MGSFFLLVNCDVLRQLQFWSLDLPRSVTQTFQGSRFPSITQCLSCPTFVSYNYILVNVQNCSCSIMMAPKDSSESCDLRRANTVFSNFTKSNFPLQIESLIYLHLRQVFLSSLIFHLCQSSFLFMTCAAKRGKFLEPSWQPSSPSVTLLRGWRSKWIQELDFGGGHKSLPTNKASKSSELLADFDFVSRQLQTVLEEQHILLNRIPRVQDVQSAWLILLHCASATCTPLHPCFAPSSNVVRSAPKDTYPSVLGELGRFSGDDSSAPIQMWLCNWSTQLERTAYFMMSGFSRHWILAFFFGGWSNSANFDFGQLFFSSSANSTSANFDFGQFRLRPISTSANFDFGQFDFGHFRLGQFDFGQFFDVEFLDHKRWGPEGWRPKPRKRWAPKPGAPKGGARRVGPERVGSPEGWGAQKGGAQKGGAQKGRRPRRVDPRKVEPRRVGPKFLLFFSLLRHKNFLSSFSLLGSLRGILVVFEAPGPWKCARLEFSGCRVRAPGGPVWWGRRGFHTTTPRINVLEEPSGKNDIVL